MKKQRKGGWNEYKTLRVPEVRVSSIWSIYTILTVFVSGFRGNTSSLLLPDTKGIYLVLIKPWNSKGRVPSLLLSSNRPS